MCVCKNIHVYVGVSWRERKVKEREEWCPLGVGVREEGWTVVGNMGV